MIEVFSFSFSSADLILFLTVALFIGMSKTGVHGAGMIAVPLLAIVFGGQRSSGIMLPMLCLADVIGVWYYHRHASWRHLRKLFPWAVLGTFLGTYVGGLIDDEAFRSVMAIIILVSISIMVWLERHKHQVPDYYWFAAVTGIAGGFTSMIGNLAGSVMAVYFLSMRLPKNAFIGTAAWFFMIMNLFKIPFHVMAWRTIDLNVFLLGLMALLPIILGAVLGIQVVKHFSERVYRWFIITMTAVAAIFMLLYHR